MMSLLIQKFINAKNSKWKSLLFFFSKFTFIIIWVILLETKRKMYIWLEKVGKLIAKQRNIKKLHKNNNQDFNYTYDILGRLEESNINNIYKTKYKYITYGNKTTTIIDEVDDNGIIYNYIYDKLGNITEIYKNNSLTNKYYYDTHSQLIKKVIFIYYYFWRMNFQLHLNVL